MKSEDSEMVCMEKSNSFDPWELVWGQPYIDAVRLSEAIENDLESRSDQDFRSRLLVRDSVVALKSHWGAEKFKTWLGQSRVQDKIEAILNENLGESGSQNIKERLVSSVSRTQIEQVFELLGKRVQKKIEVNLAGSVPSLITGLTSRPTDDIYFVDEVPEEIREQRDTVQNISSKFGLTLGHVQSHYLPANWLHRRHFMGDFGGIRVYLVDDYDIFVSKLSSQKEKHLDDLRVMAPKLEKEKVRQILITDGKSFLENKSDRSSIEANWQFIFREPLC